MDQETRLVSKSGVVKPNSHAAAVQEILSPEALLFVGALHRKFNPLREKLLQKRKEVQAGIDLGNRPDFVRETEEIRNSSWKIAPFPEEIKDRRVEITGPVDRKMVINALNSGANVFMADFEDAHSPTWKGTIEGQINLKDAIRRTIEFTSADGKKYQLAEKTSILFVRPRGWHLTEKHCEVDGQNISASLFDFGLYLFHNAQEILRRGSRPYFYLPKMESYLEARLWNDVFVFAQNQLGIPNGTIKATVLIETILASFQMDEILHELREHSAGLNCGRWDYIFSFIKKFRNDPAFVLPDRSAVNMNVHFLNSYCELLIRTCHRRGAHAMGGMAAQIPIKNDQKANEQALAKVFADKEREVNLGFDGTWVAHPGLVATARHAFDPVMTGPNQIDRMLPNIKITAQDLLTVPTGEITPKGIHTNIDVSLLYLESWLRGNGAVPLYHLMEDAATAEISRAQLWQWIRHGQLTRDHFRELLSEEIDNLKAKLGETYALTKFEMAREILDKIITSDEFVEFLTLPAYDKLE